LDDRQVDAEAGEQVGHRASPIADDQAVGAAGLIR